jgi:anti-sigma regulatory factor (Ser/Thr protein kinase)
MAEYRLRHDPTAAAIARSKIMDELSQILDPGRVDDSRLMVTELVSNAVRHASPESDGSIVLEIQREPGVARVIVRDAGSHLDLNEPAFNPGSDGHYGLFVVDALADQWGFSIDGDKGVWFEIQTD